MILYHILFRISGYLLVLTTYLRILIGYLWFSHQIVTVEIDWFSYIYSSFRAEYYWIWIHDGWRIILLEQYLCHSCIVMYNTAEKLRCIGWLRLSLVYLFSRSSMQLSVNHKICYTNVISIVLFLSF